MQTPPTGEHTFITILVPISRSGAEEVLGGFNTIRTNGRGIGSDEKKYYKTHTTPVNELYTVDVVLHNYFLGKEKERKG